MRLFFLAYADKLGSDRAKIRRKQVEFLRTSYTRFRSKGFLLIWLFLS